MNPHLWWYVARASGVVAWGLVTGSVVLGLWLSLRITKKRPRPAWTLDLHRFIGGLAVVFTGIHLAGLVTDSYVHFGAEELFVPFASSWQPDAVAWGVVGLYLLLAIEITSLGMRRLPRKLWRGVHFTSYVLFAFATIHMFAAGTDAARRSLQWVGVAAVGIVGFLTVARVLASEGRGSSADARSATRTARAATTAGRSASSGARIPAVPATHATALPAVSWSPETTTRSTTQR